MKLLLTSVFGPYGVDDPYGESDNKMELFHNQVTREQGIFSYRFHHASHGLYFLAANVDVPTTVLDFPRLRRFARELRKGYDYVGISFIVPNFEKARLMARLVRRLSPGTKIILGGHGVAVDGIETRIEHDHICRGEGIRFLRELFHEDVDRPIRHPLTYSSFNRQVMGVPWAANAGILVTGVGCPNRCRFCATSHFFGGYKPYLETGQEIYDVCCKYEDELGVTDFGVLDENFLKQPQRARELLDIMERTGRRFSFAIFSSAETLTGLGDLDLLVRLGVTFVWVGVESKREVFAKNRGVDFGRLIDELQRRGIAVMASAILFLEDHDKLTIWDDIEFATSLGADYLQFMQLGPIPGTALYASYRAQGKLMSDVPFRSQHGQGRIWFRHEHFAPAETRTFLRRAFLHDYHRNGPSILRAMRTELRGYEYCRTHANPAVRCRADEFRDMLRLMRCFVTSLRVHCKDAVSRGMLREVRNGFRRLLGRRRLKTRVLSVLVLLLSIKEALRIRFLGDVRQPKTLYWTPDRGTEIVGAGR